MVTQAPQQSGERDTLLAYLARQRDLVQWTGHLDLLCEPADGRVGDQP